jgi:hypothetical protein
MSEENVTPIRDTNALASLPPSSDEKPKDYALLARLVVREGKPFYSSAMEAGYSESIAARGLKAMMAQSKPLTDAIRRESDAFHVSVDKLRPLAINRLYFELVDPNSSNGMKAVELTGRLKELDMFVRTSETNMGILINMSDSITVSDNQAIDVSQE